MDPLTIIAIALLATAGMLAWRSARRARVHARLFAETDARAIRVERQPVATPGPIGRWLIRAGHRRSSAVRDFVLACLVFVTLGIGTTALLLEAALAERAAEMLAGLPVLGVGLGTLFRATPWLVGLAVASLPLALVARQRARRVERIEDDLPLAIELLAALVEAGNGFESSLAEVVSALERERPLAAELETFRVEVSAGDRRRDALRRLAERVGLPWMTSFTSALIHADETGASLAATLRIQARQARRSRRERALARAEALPEKLVVPLLVGFLPALLVWTLGPAFHQLFTMIDAALG